MSVQKSIAAQLEELAEIYHLAAMYAFGSRAKEIYARVQGESVEFEHPNSDVDIGVLPSSGLSLQFRKK